jgi:uncharacterized protein
MSHISILEEIKEMLIPDKEKIVAVLQKFGMSKKKIQHSIDVANFAEKIADAMEKDGKKINKKILQAGALLHDIGLTRAFDDISPEHGVIGADIVKKIGLPESLARFCEVHESCGGLTFKEAEELRLPILPLRESYAPKTIEEKILVAADFFIFILKEGPEEYGYKKFDPWKNPEELKDAMFPYVRDVYRKYLKKEITIDHPIITRGYLINKEFLNYITADMLD